jgi:tRNA(Ile)-lysidine synthetase-like protein
MCDVFLPPSGCPLIVAVSGGADSMALWSLLVDDGRWPLIIWHLNHGLRADAWRDAEAIRIFAAQHPPRALICEQADIAEEAARQGCSFETMGRRERYRRLLAVALAHDASEVVTAHHQDDQAETVLMHLLRGAGPRGAAGIPPVRVLGSNAQGRTVRLVRPLLAVPRAVLRAQVQARGIPWHEDVTNTDPAFTRNRIRHRVLPVFESGVPGFSVALAQRANAAWERIAAQDARVEAWWQEAKQGDALAVSGCLDCDDVERLARWRRLCVHLDLMVERRRLRRLDDLVMGRRDRRFRCGPWLFTRITDRLAWERVAAESDVVRSSVIPAGIGIDGLGSADFSLRGMSSMRAEVRAPGGGGILLSDIPTPAVLRFPPDQAVLSGCRFPLTLRTVRPGERWRALGSPGSRTIARWLMDRGVPARLRRRLPVLADADGVVWIPGHTIAERCRAVPGQGRVLHAVWKNPADS